MKKEAVFVLAFALLIMSAAAVPVLAVGPNKAAEVGHNPNVFINPTNQKTALNASNGDQSALDRITWYGNQIILYKNVSNSNGILNNAITADINVVNAMNSNPNEFVNKWIYLSGENSGNSYNGHGMFYWWIRSQGFSDEAALASIAARNPDGGLMKFNYVGP